MLFMSETFSKTKNAEKRFDVIGSCEHIKPIKCQAKFVVDNLNLFFYFQR